MRKRHLLSIHLLVLLAAGAALADGTPYVGTLADPTSVFEATLLLNATSEVTLQTYGFGGGTNQAGTMIAPGGTDPFVGLFSGTGNSATFINGGSLFANFSSGCPPARVVSNFGDTPCGDETFSFPSLAGGAYTVFLSDGNYLPVALFDNGTLGEGFLDFTAGQFCNLFDLSTGTPCPNTSGAFALDVLTSPATMTKTPEPASLLLLGTGLLGIARLLRRRRT